MCSSDSLFEIRFCRVPSAAGRRIIGRALLALATCWELASHMDNATIKKVQRRQFTKPAGKRQSSKRNSKIGHHFKALDDTKYLFALIIIERNCSSSYILLDQ